MTGFDPLGSHSTPERSMSASFHDERIGRFNDAVKYWSSPGGVAPTVLVKRPIKGQIKTGSNLMNGQKTRSAPFPQTFHDARNLPSPLAWAVRGDRLPSPDKPHRLLLEFQRVPRPNRDAILPRCICMLSVRKIHFSEAFEGNLRFSRYRRLPLQHRGFPLQAWLMMLSFDSRIEPGLR